MDYAAALIEQNNMLGELLRGQDWSVPVPTCPGWTLLQLLRHVGRGDRWAAQIIADRADASLDPRLVRDGRPPGDAEGAIRWLTESPRLLLAAVDDIGPHTEVSTFLGPREAAWWVRRRLHEATVHRADAAIALGSAYELTAGLAADGISEWLERLADEQGLGRPPALPPGKSMLLQATDPHLAENSWTLLGSPAGVQQASRQPASADLTLSGPAVGLLLALVRRRSAEDAGVSLEGDAVLWDSWLALTPL
jgi:uncharacterized protein (TIGR03083 family)